jgi:hypothetical protein
VDAPVKEIAVGVVGLTVTELLTAPLQAPLLMVYTTEIVPDVRPVTTPFELTDAVPVPGTIDQVPPAIIFVNAGDDNPTQTIDAPPAFAGNDPYTVNKLPTEVLHPIMVLFVYTTDTVPAVRPVTTPLELTDAVPVPGIIDQVPPDKAFVNAGVLAPIQTALAPPALAPKDGGTVNCLLTEVLQNPLL